MTRKRANGDGTIFKATRKDGTTVYKIEIVLGHDANGRPRRTRRTAATLPEAKRTLKTLHAEHLKGTATQVRTDTVLSYGLHFIRTVKSQHVRPTTAADYEDRLRRTIGPYLGNVRLTDLTAPRIEAWMSDLRLAGLSAPTINGARQVLHALCKHAARTGVIPHNPVANTDPVRRQPGETTRVQHPWTREEVHKVLSAAVHSNPLDVFLHLMLHAGMRPGEALGLRWADLDLDMRRLSITGTLKQDRRILPSGQGVVRLTRNMPKTGDSARTLPIGDALMGALERQQMRQSLLSAAEGRTAAPEYVVTTHKGTPVSASNLRKQYRTFLASLGVRPIRLHDMRHTVAVLALNDADLPLEKVSQALGHSRIDTTKRIYARQVPRYNDDFSAGIAEILPPPPRPVTADVHPGRAITADGEVA